ncbi:hypothetical protein ACJIZ3_013226 [Penstemon smallii]|uniref:Uncharacterized protein n=1 Tax=Penstemon smallii TaxID=265156 RepID=A0ABD3UP87_9LAMI
MDSDFWKTRIAAAKRQFNLQHQNHHHTPQLLDRLNMDDFEVEEETRPDFPCPYCYEEFDIASLCSHLEDEHSCESKATICPVCSVKVTRDVLSHITLQHGHLFKRRHRLRRVGVPNSRALSLLGKDLREAHLQVLLGGSGYRSNTAMSSNAAATDTTTSLSSHFLNLSPSETDEFTKSVMLSMEDSTKSNSSQHTWKSSFDSSLSHEEREERTRQAAGRAVFVQDMLVSILLAD